MRDFERALGALSRRELLEAAQALLGELCGAEGSSSSAAAKAGAEGGGLSALRGGAFGSAEDLRGARAADGGFDGSDELRAAEFLDGGADAAVKAAEGFEKREMVSLFPELEGAEEARRKASFGSGQGGIDAAKGASEERFSPESGGGMGGISDFFRRDSRR